MKGFRLLAATPPAAADPAIAVAAARAGETGVLNLEFVADERVARAAIERLARLGRGLLGVKLGNNPQRFQESVTSDFPAEIRLAILQIGAQDDLVACVRRLRDRGVEVLVEVTSLEDARLAEQAGADGLVGKGSESGGWIGEETSFILLQRLLASSKLPVFVSGGIGRHTVAAAFVAGAAGAVLGSELLLTRECGLPEDIKARIRRMDGSETASLAPAGARACRLYTQPGLPALAALQERSERLHGDEAAWRHEVSVRAGWSGPEEHVWLLGQDAAFAAPLARRFVTVGGVLAGLRQALDEHVAAARSAGGLGEGSALAASHGTRYSIVQGPMTRVSDRAEFARAVGEQGALPLLALALMRAPEVERLLADTRRLLGELPWGVGILGFVPLELRDEQLAVIRAYRPPFALIAGGRPDQARALEQDGIPTYLHVPSPGLLRQFLRDGARRFVFEGRECGGHVGPRSSFVLWDTMLDVLHEELAAGEESTCHVLFAGGVHDAVSAAMVSVMAATIAARGVRVGALLGTAYLFTEEAVASGAITPGFQEQAVQCDHTVTLDTGPGHSIRAVETPYAREFASEKARLIAEGLSREDIRLGLEAMNIGRLRIASKGITRGAAEGRETDTVEYVTVGPEEQYRRGMYMIGQLAALRDRTCTVADLHRAVAVDSSRRIADLAAVQAPARIEAQDPRPSQVAIVGMSCILPKARDLRTYWANILSKVSGITEIPPSRWDAALYFDPDRSALDRIYSKWGGFLDEEPFDPLEFGMPPASLPSIDPMQLLALKAARAALDDAGYLDRPFDRSRASVILGASGGTGDLGAGYLLRSSLPLLFGEQAADIVAQADGRLPEWTEDSFAGLLLNVAAGRIANRFDFGGFNYVVDAACASSLAAVHLAVKELETHGTDLALVGGVDTTQNPFGYLCFSKTQALSPTGQARTFDATADGIAISEGLVMIVLKRLADAERDGDRIYAVIQAVSGSSDGRAKGLTAPRPEGQELALRRAYAKAGFSPATVALFEAHGTGTVVGDRTEALAVSAVLDEAGVGLRSAAIGSVKSMIGHTKATAGVAGLAKVALALHHKVLPPTLGVSRPNPKSRFGEGPLYVNSESRPWLAAAGSHPRRAAVSSFGFGGTNFHAVVEEYTGEFLEREAPLQNWPSELLVWTAPAAAQIVAAVDALAAGLDRGARPRLCDVAHATWCDFKRRGNAEPGAGAVLAIVASSLDDLRAKLGRAREALASSTPLTDPTGVYAIPRATAVQGSVAFVFPGQGSQYPDMVRDLALLFAEVREEFERFDRVLAARFPAGLSRHVFPPPAFDAEDERRQRQELTDTRVAQPALGAAGLALLRLLRSMGVEAQMAAGHSYGEYVALCAAEVIDPDTLAALSEARGRSIAEAAADDLGTMAAVNAPSSVVEQALEGVGEVWIANVNAPEQTIVSGTTRGIEHAVTVLGGRGLSAKAIPVACAFHSPVVAPARERLAAYMSNIQFLAPRLEVFSNTTAAPYPADPGAITALLADHLVRPVRFADEIEAMYAAGARVFVEVGPKNVLSGLIGQILAARPHLALALDAPGRHGLTQFQHGLARLAVHGVAVDLARLYRGRGVRTLRLDALELEAEPISPTTWLVSGGGIRKWDPAPPPPRASAPLALPQAVAPALAAGPAPAAPVPAVPAAATPVVLQFQQLMNRFLDTQREVMQAYLRAGAATAPAVDVPVAVTASPAPPRIEPPPAPAAPAPVAEQPPPPDEADREGLTAQLLRIVSDRTGYPPEMLDLDVDIEAELGIDSIKRVEILGSVRKACLPAGREIDERSMEQLTALKTLRGIADWLAAAAAGTPAMEQAPVQPAPAVQASVEPAPPAPLAAPLPRAILVPAAAPLIQSNPLRTDSGVIVLTDDGHGVAAALAERLRAAGIAFELLSEGTVDVGDVQSVGRALASIRATHGAVRGIVHLLPLRLRAHFAEMDLDAWRTATRLGTKSLFYLAQAAASDLRAADVQKAIVLAATACSHPEQAGVAGLLKTLALEWPSVRCRAVGVDPELAPAVLADRLFDELAARGSVEVFYDGDRRFAFEPRMAPLDLAVEGGIAIGPDSVILVTGGARGITAEAACELAERFRPTLVLAGRSTEPAGDELPETRGIDGARELKAALMDALRRASGAVSIQDVEAAYARLLREREMRANLQRMRATGARVQYVQTDVCDERAMTALLADIRRTHGRLDGVVHGAGLIEDKLIEQKAPESFDRVFDTKADSAFLLGRLLAAAPPRFLVLFGSVSGSFGNRGQADYAAANAVLGELARGLDRRWPGRVVALAWGPWLKTGMVSPELQREFARRGVRLIEIAEGCEALLRELRCGAKGEADVILAGGGLSGAAELPLLAAAREAAGELERTLDPARDLYLRDHCMDGKPVLPLAMALELMAEAAQRGRPDLQVVAIEDLRVLKGIVLDDGPRTVRVRLGGPASANGTVRVAAEIDDTARPGQPCYRAIVELAERLPEPPQHVPPSDERFAPFPLSVDEAYRQWLFHGPRFRGITQIEGLGERAIAATLMPSTPAALLADRPPGQWLVDPVVFDSGLQLFLLWARAHLDKTPLPSRLARYRRFAPLAGAGVRCLLRVLDQSRDPVFNIDIAFVGPDGRLLGLLENMEGACSRALNRLSAAEARQFAPERT